MTKHLFAPLCFFLLLCASLAQAATETVSVSARGYGDNPEQAMTNALVAAVRATAAVLLERWFATDVTLSRRILVPPGQASGS